MARIIIEVDVAPGASLDDAAERLFEYLISDPLDEYPEIEAVLDWRTA